MVGGVGCPSCAAVIAVSHNGVKPSAVKRGVISRICRCHNSSAFQSDHCGNPEIFAFSRHLGYKRLIACFHCGRPFGNRNRLSRVHRRNTSAYYCSRCRNGNCAAYYFFNLSFSHNNHSCAFRPHLSLILVCNHRFVAILRIFSLSRKNLLSKFSLPFSFFLFRQKSKRQK